MHNTLKNICAPLWAIVMGAALLGCDPGPSSAPETEEVILEVINAPTSVVEIEVFTAEGWLWDVYRLNCHEQLCVHVMSIDHADEEGPFEFRPSDPGVALKVTSSSKTAPPGSTSSIGNGPLTPPGTTTSIGNGPLRQGKEENDG
ncbi:MAG: hypothetical protein ACE366_02165 [Bradymonadia bacterium]